MLPAALPMLLVFTEDFETRVSVAATLTVADVALLFVNKAPTLTFNEQATIMNLVLLLATSMLNYFCAHYLHMPHELISEVTLIAALFCLCATFALGWYQYGIAARHSQRVADALRHKDLTAISDLV